MSETRYPWSLDKVPNYHSAPAVDIEDAAKFDAATFRRRYELHNRPCLIKGAVKTWPAFTKWREDGYVLSKIGDFAVRASCSPRIEGFGLRSMAQDSAANKMTQEQLLPAEKVRRLLPRIRTPDNEVLFIELRPANPEIRCLEEDIGSDGKRFPFLPKPPIPRFGYSGWAVMFYKNSYSDWHFHPGTEAIMCQVVGAKDVLLLPPTQESWDQIVPVHIQQWKVYDVDLREMPAFRNIRPLHVVVEPGDGLYLPVNWWHAVQARPQEHGITIPVTWDSSYRDLRQPATRHFVRVLWRRQKSLGLSALLATIYGTAANCVRQQRRNRV